jgi:pimeloyl-ACP methyl ester carboxylesterase
VIITLERLALGPAVLVGHSMGGMVAQEVAARAPQAVAGLVLASTSPAFGKPGGDWQQGFLKSRFAPLDAGLGMAGLAAQLVPTMVAPGTAAGPIAAAQALMAAVPEATYRSAVAALVAFDRRADLPRITAPTLVITGEHDRTAPPDVARKMAERIPGARCSIVPGAGHLLNLEQPQAFNAALLGFLSTCRT